MAITIINGVTDAGNLSDRYTRGSLAYLINLEIMQGNTVSSQHRIDLNALLDAFTVDTPMRDGQRINTNKYNVLWTSGGINSDAPMFKRKVASFTFEREGFNLANFQFDADMILSAEENGIDLYQNVLEDITAARISYQENYLPNVKLLALIAGASVATEIQAVDAGGDYESGFGPLRGEDCVDILRYPSATAEDNYRYGFRAKKGASLALSDLRDIVDYIEGFRGYTGNGIICLAKGSRINELGDLYNDTMNQDSVIFEDFTEGGIRSKKIGDVEYISVPAMHKDFMVFIDMGKMRRLIYRIMSVRENQRGLALMSTKDLNLFDQIANMDGSKMHIFKEAYFNIMREAVVVLDVQNNETDGLFGATSVTAFNAWITALRAAFTRS